MLADVGLEHAIALGKGEPIRTRLATSLDAHDGAHATVLAYPNCRGVDGRRKLELDKVCVAVELERLRRVVRVAHCPRDVVCCHRVTVVSGDGFVGAVSCLQTRAPSQVGVAICEEICLRDRGHKSRNHMNMSAHLVCAGQRVVRVRVHVMGGHSSVDEWGMPAMI
eukprot:5550401-Prymnesium_polylepis.2